MYLLGIDEKERYAIMHMHTVSGLHLHRALWHARSLGRVAARVRPRMHAGTDLHNRSCTQLLTRKWGIPMQREV